VVVPNAAEVAFKRAHPSSDSKVETEDVDVFFFDA
jgi:hypothetical protein